VIFFGGAASYVLLVFYGYGGFSPWLLLFITSFAVAFWEYATVNNKAVELSRRKREKDIIEIKFGGGFADKFSSVH